VRHDRVNSLTNCEQTRRSQDIVEPTSLSHLLGSLDTSIDMSIVIVNWNTSQLLSDCLQSIQQHHDGVSIEVIVVDNGSRDDSIAMIRRAFPSTVLIENGRNLGFAVANNRGLAVARGRFLLLLNSDTLATAGALRTMIAYLDDPAHHAVGALGPRLQTGDGMLQLSTRDFPRLDHDAAILLEVKDWPILGDLARRYADRSYAESYTYTHQVDWVQGSCLLLRRESLAQVGLLDEGYFFDYEESDLCFRLRRAGWTTVYFADACIVHFGGQSRKKAASITLVWHYRSMLRYYRLHASYRRYIAVRLGVLVVALGHVLWRLTVRWSTPGDRQAAAAYAHIAADAFRGAGW